LSINFLPFGFQKLSTYSRIRPKQELANILYLVPTVDRKDSFYWKYRRLLYILAAAMMICVYVATSKIVIAICGALLTGLFIAAFYEIRTSKDFPASTKRISWLFLFCAAAIIYVTYAKLTGNWDPG
jgi:hypothetical protein